MFALSNAEKAKLPKLGKTIYCQRCMREHKVENHDKEDAIAFYKCHGTTYLAGIDGKDVTGVIEERRKAMSKRGPKPKQVDKNTI